MKVTFSDKAKTRPTHSFFELPNGVAFRRPRVGTGESKDDIYLKCPDTFSKHGNTAVVLNALRFNTGYHVSIASTEAVEIVDAELVVQKDW